MIRWLLRGVVLLQLIASGSALESVKSLIVYGTEILPRGLGVASALFACHVVAFAAIFGRVDQTRSRMMVLVVCELAGVSMALGWPGLSRDIVLARSPLPPNEIYGSSWGLGWIVMMQWLGVALSPIPVAVGVWQGSRLDGSHRRPVSRSMSRAPWWAER